MNKFFLKGNTSINKNTGKKNYSDFKSLDQQKVVDVNKLLNRVKLDKKMEIKKNITFYTSVILILTAAGTLVSIIK